MQLRKLVLACGLASFALSNYASALGLGEVKLNSRLNQPLSADIKLLEVQDLTAEQILIALASPADFERNGVDRLYFYTEFQFSVDLQHAGGPIVRVSTRNPVREPYLNFLIEARWSAGRLLREYTLLMDLPTFDSTPAQAVQAPETAKPKVTAVKPRPVPAPVSETPAAPAFAPSEAKADEVAEQESPKKKPKISSGTYGPIDGKDTLWEIAKVVRPDSSVSVHQTMIALQRLNPEAFIRGNINLLKKGQVLRVPDVEQAAAVDRSEAVNQVANQNNKWSNPSAAGADTEMEAQLDASRAASTTQQKSEPISGRVKLEAPTASGGSEDGLGSGSDKAGGKGLEAKLASNLEELDKAKSENTELTSRVLELEERLKTMQRLVDVSNEKMSALQLSAAQQADAAAAVKSAAEAPVAEAPGAEAADETAVAVSSAAEVVPAVSSAPAKKKTPVKQNPKAEKTLVEHLSDNILWVALGAVSIAGAGVVYMRRRKEEDEDVGDFPEPQSFYIPEPVQGFETPNEPSQPHTDTQFAREEVIPEDENVSGVAETDDVVSEAGIYITLGKYSQAEDMLLNALDTNTASSGVYLKLLEVYSHTQNVTEFDRHYAALWPIGSPFELHRASELRASIADAGIFRGSDNSLNEVVSNDFVPSAADAPVDENIDVSARRYDLDFGKTAVVAATAGNILLGDQTPELNFDLDHKKHPDAEDLSDISLALDSLDERKEEIVAEDIEVTSLEDDLLGIDEEISFDFNELDAGKSDFTLKDAAADLKFPEDEDFNLEMDVDDIDLAALDREMDHLDSGTAADAETAAIEPLELDSLDKNQDEDLDHDLEGFDALFENSDLVDEQKPLDENLAPPADFAGIDLGQSLDVDGEALELNEEPLELDDESFALDDELILPEDDSELTTSVLDIEKDEVVAVDIEGELDALEDHDLELPDDDLTLDSSADIIQSDEALPVDLVTDDTSLADLDEELENLDKAAVKAPLVEIDSDDDIDEEVFNLALSDFSAESLNAEAEAEDLAAEDADAELDFMVDADEAATKLDLARAYLDMGDNEGAREILAEVAQEGSEQQREEAIGLLSRIDV